MSSGGSNQKPPDYVGAAREQGEQNLKAAIATGVMNNPNVNSPFGKQQTSWRYETDAKGNIIRAIPTTTQTLSPEQQALYKQGSQAKWRAGEGARAAAWNAYNTVKSPIQDPQMYRDDVINAMMSRYNTQFGGMRDQANSDMIAAGLRPGTKAYQNAMDAIGRQQNDATMQAILAGGQEASRDFGMDMTRRQTPINEYSALMSGSQINNPFAGGLGFQGGMSVGAAPVANAYAAQQQWAQNQANMNQAQYNANLGAGAGLIGSLGSAALMR